MVLATADLSRTALIARTLTIHSNPVESYIFLGPSEYAPLPFRVQLDGLSAYKVRTFRVFPPDPPRTHYKEAREPSDHETSLEKCKSRSATRR